MLCIRKDYFSSNSFWRCHCHEVLPSFSYTFINQVPLSSKHKTAKGHVNFLRESLWSQWNYVRNLVNSNTLELYELNLHVLLHMSGSLSILKNTLSWRNSAIELAEQNRSLRLGIYLQGESIKCSPSFHDFKKYTNIFFGKKNHVFSSVMATEHKSIVLLVSLFFLKLQEQIAIFTQKHLLVSLDLQW